MPEQTDTSTLRQELYDLRLRATRLQQEILATTDPAVLDELLKDAGQVESDISSTEASLRQTEQAGAKAESQHAVTRSNKTTALDATVSLRMTHIPTAIYHLLDTDASPLLEVELVNTAREMRRVRVTARVEGYSADAVATVELDRNGEGVRKKVKLLPTLFPQATDPVHELTRATVTVLVEELIYAGENSAKIGTAVRIENHDSLPIWMLARNSAPLAVRDPQSGAWVDLTRYFGAFVTPNRPEVMAFLRKAAAHHPQKRLAGYQSDVTAQARAIFDALKEDADITYVNSLIAFNPDESARGQRVRLPRESLAERQANCIDGTLLFASLLEAASLHPAIVVVPGHAFVAWERSADSGRWAYLETTMIGTNTFAEAQEIGGRKAEFWEKQAADGDANKFRRWPLKELRTAYGITPLE
ncbi:MAG: hypothetical protein KIT77_23845 [Caldilinea sp.]|nr:hypothetical protein [Caldilinea sp.]MCB0152335.1 hypothetical protein [Caldilineaceae bacterium]MCB9116853.1 hypothetical protein [Caldilineaceae bacterium]MCB9125783.1 hypothetical protein [Caldilineaceae bacterium]MCW5844305.1 hypothetical protein [Caldilinea sp.]